jgi:hypothetical protein
MPLVVPPLGFPRWIGQGFVAPSIVGGSRPGSNLLRLGPDVPIVNGGTINMGVGTVTRIRMAGLDSLGGLEPLADQIFQALGKSSLFFTVGPTDPPDPSAALLYAVAPGSGTLSLGADGDTGPGRSPLSAKLTLNVYAYASKLVLYWTPTGGHEIRYDNAGAITVPLDKTLSLRLVGEDVNGFEARLATPQLRTGVGGSGTPYFHIVDNGDGTGTLIPDLVTTGFDQLIWLTAGGDYLNPGTLPLILTGTQLVTSPTASSLAITYDTEPAP